jgi:hypothetical protein
VIIPAIAPTSSAPATSIVHERPFPRFDSEATPQGLRTFLTSSVRRTATTAIVALALIGLTVGALTQDRQNGFWASHPFLGGMATGALTLAFTILLLDKYLARRENYRWRRVAAVAYRGVARESRDISALLASLYCDTDHRIGSSYEDPNWTTYDLSPIGEIRRLPDGKHELKVFAQPLPPQDDPDDLLPEERARVLLADRDWCALAARELDQSVDRNRDTVARWAPLMMAADEPRDLLNAFASLNDELFNLHVKLRLRGQGLDQGSVDDVLTHWRVIDGKARLLTNHLWRKAGEGHYSLRLPPVLHRLDYPEAFRQLGRLAHWRATVHEHYDSARPSAVARQASR